MLEGHIIKWDQERKRERGDRPATWDRAPGSTGYIPEVGDLTDTPPETPSRSITIDLNEDRVAASYDPSRFYQ